MIRCSLEKEDNKTLAKTIRISNDVVNISTPTKVLEILESNPEASTYTLIKPRLNKNTIVEIRLNLSSNRINNIDSDREKMSKFISRFDKLVKEQDNIKLLYIIYKPETLKLNEDDLNLITDFIISSIKVKKIDGVIIPNVIPRETISDNAKLLNFKEEFIKEFLNRYDNKYIDSLLGYIPKTTHRRVADIINMYIKYHVENIAVDFSGSTPISYRTELEAILRNIKIMQRELNKDLTYMHAINVNRGLGKELTIPAKDILCVCFGIDSFSYYIKNFIPLLINEEPTYRIFNSDDYSYKQVSKKDLKDEGLKEGILLQKKLKQTERAINTKLQFLELSTNIQTQINDKTLYRYLNNKTNIQQDIEIVGKIIDKIKNQQQL
jgi:hypothetical protein